MALPSIKNSVGMAVTAVADAGVGTLTVGAALSGGYQTAATAYGADANIDIRVDEGNNWEVCRDCLYDHSELTVTRGTQEDGSSGPSTRVAFTTAAKVYVVESAARLTTQTRQSLNHIWFLNTEYIQYVSSTSIKINGAGEAVVNGELLTWSSDITWSGTSGTTPLAAVGMVYGYLYNNSGTPALEVSTTAPELDSTNRYWRKTSDSSRRCVWSGYVWATTGTVYRIVPFLCRNKNTMAEIYYQSEYVDASNSWDQNDLLVLANTGITASVAATSVTLSFIAAHATEWWCSAKIGANAANSEAALGFNSAAWSGSQSTTEGCIEYTVRAEVANNSDTVFFGRSWLPVKTAQTTYYGVLYFNGTVNIYVECRGMRFPL